MDRNRLIAVASLVFALFSALGLQSRMRAQEQKSPYPAMAPLEQYLMDGNAEIALARSAAPESISRDAEVLVLGRNGYETAAKQERLTETAAPLT
jgi:hypothetical protein